jgi:two-component system, NarL family, sensor kinase
MRSRSPSESRSSTSAAVLGLVAGALAAAVLERRRHRGAERRREREQRERESERFWLSAQLVTAEQEERRRLALALHDGPLQSLSGIALMHDAGLKSLREGRPDEAAMVLAGALERERKTIQTLRDLSFALEPVVLRDHGLEAAVRALADQLRVRAIDVTLDLTSGEDLGEKAQVALYQTLREALDQAVRRKPRRVEVTIGRREDGAFEARVADDGMGERRRANADAIAERARILGGTVSVEPGEPSGTVVTVRLLPYVAAV